MGLLGLYLGKVTRVQCFFFQWHGKIDPWHKLQKWPVINFSTLDKRQKSFPWHPLQILPVTPVTKRKKIFQHFFQSIYVFFLTYESPTRDMQKVTRDTSKKSYPWQFFHPWESAKNLTVSRDIRDKNLKNAVTD